MASGYQLTWVRKPRVAARMADGLQATVLSEDDAVGVGNRVAAVENRARLHHPHHLGAAEPLVAEVVEPAGEVIGGREQAGRAGVRVAEHGLRVARAGSVGAVPVVGCDRSVGIGPVHDHVLMVVVEVGPVHAERAEDALRREFGEGHAADGLYGLPQEGVAHVRIQVLRTGHEVEFALAAMRPRICSVVMTSSSRQPEIPRSCHWSRIPLV